jgi:general secretion pathway protein C
MRLSLDTRARRLLRRLPVVSVYSVAEIALLSLLAVQCARLAWAVVTPVSPIGEWKIPAVLGGSLPASLALGDFDPFFRLQAASPATVVVTSLAVKLFGVRVDRASGRDSAILSTPDGVQSSYAVGDEIMPGVRLAGVREDGVTLDRGGQREQLFLDQSIPAANATPGAGGASAGAGGITPRLVNGQVSGLTIASPPPVLAQAGIRPGDVVMTINGAAVSSAADAQALATGLTPGSSVSVQVERGGQLVPITVTVPVR